ncbi:orotidine 5'-phosphate decarboxylase [Pneumocystis murina B123]|uniref:Orotidine 5'-phosphate decarboxylase n=1 Tax=Pneumocystis murina (strain B123) TaxID=1069680 RepID=M7NLL2_PNEMU|nr:orotidine 5'-phosphate decarboxylase [Pneumocystis murina B123]EMR09553.1 orotidine 5'-phosphate decarboxylase [Pneumocystis murina B123]
MSINTIKMTYKERSKLYSNKTAQRLLELMDRKQTNLSVAADFTKKQEVLDFADKTGPYICILKTHVDIIEDFDISFIFELKKLAEKHDFLIFEDRKFADIGKTVQLQYSSGIYKISEWADIINAHPMPGEGIIDGLKKIGEPQGRGLFLLAEMSSKGCLSTEEYVNASIKMAKKNKEFVIGFISIRRWPILTEEFILMTPGVGYVTNNDSVGNMYKFAERDVYGQQYRTPENVILDLGSDIIIVGRNIYASGKDIVTETLKYKNAGWKAYMTRIS